MRGQLEKLAARVKGAKTEEQLVVEGRELTCSLD